MLILCETRWQPSQLINSLGKYLFKNLGGSINFKKSSNTFTLWTLILYQIPYSIIKKYNLPNIQETDVQEMTICIDMTTYQNKLRFNIIEETPDQQTLGCKVINLQLSKYQNVKTNQELFHIVMEELQKYIYSQLSKRYDGYDFLY